ncbi:Sulfotransferase family cytosolic 1B member 1 [Seminavis robusta]|uniref:Sulfotransferase family cytosolic 1B member 1 n=1 Tax=Seminavis robusta TaxID=568900 RepID=A0A9N8ESL6_9STRA|nr:Sulfotransferase family cytosolic 1B member 1 [Seminavis robusta]|eukprot:Sro1659_g289190.1 Sulfotransferase family cytosolic 1B member 1 (318) ;mRNA; r:1308-2261
MTDSTIQWPKKTKEMESHHFDSTVWNDFKFRDDDIVIATYGKSGTTWTQQIISQLIFQGDTTLDVAGISPWVDLRVPPKPIQLAILEEQKHRRFVKTHLPVDALVFSPQAKYLYVVRDGRDVAWSLFHHHMNANAEWYAALNDTPGLVGPKIGKPVSEDPVEYYKSWFDNDGAPFWSFWEHMKSWWAIRDLPNVKFVHFNDLKKDLSGQMREISEFLEIPINEDKFDEMVEHCTFDYMKKHASQMSPLGGALWNGGGATFINKGTNGRWADLLSDEDCQAYEKKAVEELGEECAEYLKNGSLATVVPQPMTDNSLQQ